MLRPSVRHPQLTRPAHLEVALEDAASRRCRRQQPPGHLYRRRRGPSRDEAPTFPAVGQNSWPGPAASRKRRHAAQLQRIKLAAVGICVLRRLPALACDVVPALVGRDTARPARAAPRRRPAELREVALDGRAGNQRRPRPGSAVWNFPLRDEMLAVNGRLGHHVASPTSLALAAVRLARAQRRESRAPRRPFGRRRSGGAQPKYRRARPTGVSKRGGQLAIGFRPLAAFFPHAPEPLAAATNARHPCVLQAELGATQISARFWAHASNRA